MCQKYGLYGAFNHFFIWSLPLIRFFSFSPCSIASTTTPTYPLYATRSISHLQRSDSTGYEPRIRLTGSSSYSHHNAAIQRQLRVSEHTSSEITPLFAPHSESPHISTTTEHPTLTFAPHLLHISTNYPAFSFCKSHQQLLRYLSNQICKIPPHLLWRFNSPALYLANH